MLNYTNIAKMILYYPVLALLVLFFRFSAAKSILIPEENIILPPGCLSYSECTGVTQNEGYSSNIKETPLSDTSSKTLLGDKKISRDLKKFYTRYLKNSIKCHIDAIMGMSSSSFCKDFVQKLDKNQETYEKDTEPGLNKPTSTTGSTSLDSSVSANQGYQNNKFANMQNDTFNNLKNTVPIVYSNPCLKGHACSSSDLSYPNIAPKLSYKSYDLPIKQNQAGCMFNSEVNKISSLAMPTFSKNLLCSGYNEVPFLPNQNQSLHTGNINLYNPVDSYSPIKLGIDPTIGCRGGNTNVLFQPQLDYTSGFPNYSYNNLRGLDQHPSIPIKNRNFEIPNNFDYQGCISNFISCIEKIKKKKLNIP